MRTEPIRVGIVGAGANTRLKHIPGLRAIPNVEIVSVANRTRDSGERVAREFGIPKVYDHWLELVEADDTDAICIGTWPYLHCPVTLAALENDKHVLCEARMALNAAEAHIMLEAARHHPHLVTQVVPAPHTLAVDGTIQKLIAHGYLGEVLTVELRGLQPTFVDREGLLHWRYDVDLSGFNTLTMGIWYEAMMRWVGPASRVMAMTKVCVPQRKDMSGLLRTVTVPDHVDIIAHLACGAIAHLRFSAVTGLAPANEVWLFGTEGTLRLDTASLELYGGRRRDKDQQKIVIPQEELGRWRVEEEFVNAIRGTERVTHTSFEDGVRYMEFTEAVIRSAQSCQAVNLPL
ncbi:MAG: Gfo/Idh/MocA family oxidoreductase [candidate division NC10 bacterium]|nr:Gfo/Idh/MocA family oxidoreductase [candidate division NC10 bacterium]